MAGASTALAHAAHAMEAATRAATGLAALLEAPFTPARAILGSGSAGTGSGAQSESQAMSGTGVPGWMGVVQLEAGDEEGAARMAALLRGLFRAQEEHRCAGACCLLGFTLG